MALIFWSLATIPFRIVARDIYLLIRNIQAAKRSGIPYLVIPVSHGNPFRLVFGGKITDLLSYLLFTKSFVRVNESAWEANQRYRIHNEYGGIFMTVAPGKLVVLLADPLSISDIYRRKDDFPRDLKTLEMLDVYGRSITTTDGAEWQKHRKVTAVTFTDRNTRLKEPISTLLEDSVTFTLNVLAAALFAKPYPVQGQNDRSEKVDTDASKYRNSLSTILQNILAILALEPKALTKSWMPKGMQSVGRAIYEFESYAKQLIHEERNQIKASEHVEVPSLAKLLVRACKEEDSQKTSSTTSTLTENEIVSNLFVYAFAGNDTTSITLSQTLVFLPAHPETQDWVHEERKHYLRSDDISTWECDVFPQLSRCLAVIMESLRLSSPFGLVIKMTGNTSQPIVVHDISYIIPPNTLAEANVTALYTNPQHWGPDAYTWNPSRFIDPSSTTGIDSETTLPDTSFNFLAWSTGKRACPGNVSLKLNSWVRSRGCSIAIV